jgi:mRNA interferase MazF
VNKGDIVIVEFPYTDLISTKLRPSIILLENRFDYMICFITSNIKLKDTYDILLQPTLENGLRAKSIIKTNKIITIDKLIVKGKIGQLNKDEINMLNMHLTLLLKLN